MIDETTRTLGIGGSEVAALFNCHPFKSRFGVWSRKKGGVPYGPADTRMILGKFLEEGALRMYTHMTGRPIEYCDRSSRHPQRPWHIFTPDALCRDERRGVDAKVVFWDQRDKWAVNEPPEYVQFQAWWYMAGTGYDVWDIAALLVDEMRIYTIERLEPNLEERMLERVREWVERYLVGDDIPPRGGDEATHRWLQQKYPAQKTDIRPATFEEAALLSSYVDVRVMQKKLQATQAEMEAAIKEAIEDAEGLRWPEGVFTWKKTKDSETTEWATLGKILLDKYVKDKDQRGALLSIYTHPKPGARRIHVKHPALKESAE